jgi:dihydroorotate dehydrogenase electron transfer subunit
MQPMAATGRGCEDGHFTQWRHFGGHEDETDERHAARTGGDMTTATPSTEQVPAPRGASRLFTGTVTATTPIMGDSSLITFTAPQNLVVGARPGQFVSILCRNEGAYDPLLRRPISIYRADPEAGELTILVRPFGRGSAWLASRPEGESLDVLGPLGNQFEISPRSMNLLMVAGGVGAAPLLMLAEEAVQKGLSVTYLMGSATEEGLLPSSAFRGEIEYVVATDDGSRGHHGFVTDLIPEYLQWADQIFTCGPTPMFHSLRNVVLKHRMGKKPPVQLSVERTMACALGACLGCVVETKRGMVTSCVDGPVFDMDEVVWS